MIDDFVLFLSFIGTSFIILAVVAIISDSLEKKPKKKEYRRWIS